MTLRTLFNIARETFYLLKRGPIFIPAIFFTIIIGAFASLASMWGVVEFRKILFDIGGFGFHVIGSMIAIIWSTKIVSVARLDGSLEVQLASPVSRAVWLTGRFLGIFFSLILMGILMLLMWQAIMLLTNFGAMRMEELTAFTLQIIGWGVVASIALFFSTFCGLITALFASFALWISGLLTELAALTIKEDQGVFLVKFFKVLSYFWNLQNFNRTPALLLEHGLQFAAWSALYGILLTAFFLSFATIAFSRSFE